MKPSFDKRVTINQFKEVEEEAVTNWSKYDFPIILLTAIIFYHRRLSNEPTGTIISL